MRDYALRIKSHLKFMPRIPELQRIAGRYKTTPNVLVELHKASGSKLKFSSWLAKTGINPGSKIGKQICNSANPTEFVVSVKYNDILRCSTMYSKQYFDSCLKPGGSNSLNRQFYCEYLDHLGILYVPDAAGHIKSRAFFFYIKKEDLPSVFPYTAPNEVKCDLDLNSDYIIPLRFYGDAPLGRCFDTLIENNPHLKLLTDNRLRSAMSHANIIFKHDRSNGGHLTINSYICIDWTNSYNE